MSTTTPSHAPAQATSPPKRPAWKSTLLKLAFSLTLMLVLFELACQVMLWRMHKSWQAVRDDPRHPFGPSADPTLVYELAPGYDHTNEGRWLRVNRHGIRDDADDVPPATRKIALLGDSAVFGSAHSQEDTLTALLQQQLDPTRRHIAVFNFGVNGYGLREVPVFLRNKNAIYDVDEVVYVLNPNDFSWRDTVYEGADNGLYRTYHRPLLASPLFVRKAIYRYQKAQSLSTKNEVLVSVRWYKWMYGGNRARGFDKLRELKQYAQQNQIKLTVMPLPAACAYTADGYALRQMYDEISGFVSQLGVRVLDPSERFAEHIQEWIDDTDHLTLAGNRAMAKYLAGDLTAPTATQAARRQADAAPYTVPRFQLRVRAADIAARNRKPESVLVHCAQAGPLSPPARKSPATRLTRG